jgi:nitrogen fixation NifU-like protein
VKKEKNDFEKFIKELQQKINKEEEKYYSKKLIEEYRNPTNFGEIKNPDISNIKTGPCGDTMKIDLKIKDDLITDARFWTDGCGASIACGNVLTKMIKGKSLQEAKNLSEKNIISELGGLPIENKHCSILCINTLYEGINKLSKDR